MGGEMEAEWILDHCRKGFDVSDEAKVEKFKICTRGVCREFSADSISFSSFLLLFFCASFFHSYATLMTLISSMYAETSRRLCIPLFLSCSDEAWPSSQPSEQR